MAFTSPLTLTPITAVPSPAPEYVLTVSNRGFLNISARAWTDNLAAFISRENFYFYVITAEQYDLFGVLGGLEASQHFLYELNDDGSVTITQRDDTEDRVRHSEREYNGVDSKLMRTSLESSRNFWLVARNTNVSSDVPEGILENLLTLSRELFRFDTHRVALEGLGVGRHSTDDNHIIARRISEHAVNTLFNTETRESRYDHQMVEYAVLAYELAPGSLGDTMVQQIGDDIGRALNGIRAASDELFALGRVSNNDTALQARVVALVTPPSSASPTPASPTPAGQTPTSQPAGATGS